MGKNTKLGSALAIAVIAATCLAASTANATVYYLTTGQTGPNVTVDAIHNDSWLLNEPVDFSFGGGDFTIKSPGPTADITLTLYLGNSSAGTSLDSVTVVGGTVTNAYTSTPFHFGPDALLKNTNYFVQLSSSTATTGSRQYDIKDDGTFFVADANGTPLTASVAAPEPATLAILGLAISGLGMARRRRASKA